MPNATAIIGLALYFYILGIVFLVFEIQLSTTNLRKMERYKMIRNTNFVISMLLLILGVIIALFGL